MGNVEFDDMPKIALQKANRKLVEGVQPYDQKAVKPFSMGYLSGFQAERRDLAKRSVWSGDRAGYRAVCKKSA